MPGQEPHRAHAVVPAACRPPRRGSATSGSCSRGRASRRRRGRREQFRRRILGEPGRGEDADAPLPCRATPCSRSSMRCRPSSRIFGENRGASPLARTSGDIGDPPSRSVADSANTQRSPVLASAGRRPVPADVLDHGGAAGADRLERADHGHQRGFFSRDQAGGLHRQAIAVGEPEVLVEPARERCAEMRVAVDEAREQRLAAAVVDLGLRIRLQDLFGGPDRRDAAAHDRQCDVVLNAVDVDDRGVGEDHRPCGGRLGLGGARVEQQRGGAGAGTGEQFTPTDVGRVVGKGRCWHGASYRPGWRKSTSPPASAGRWRFGPEAVPAYN